MIRKVYLFIILFILSCSIDHNESEHNSFLVAQLPKTKPIVFMPNLIEENQIIHKGIFSPDYESYFYTVSKNDFTNFNILQLKKNKGKWSKPKAAFINSQFDDHGMSFSPDGRFLYFSSTRPVEVEGVSNTWHIWRSEKIDGKWEKPKYIDIPNMRTKLTSHPSISNNGIMYFHSSNLDYSEMNIYSSQLESGIFQNAQIVKFKNDLNFQKCTPFISPDERYLIFAELYGDQLNLNISFKDSNDEWNKPKEFNKEINTRGQGNPFITPDGKYLLFTSINNTKDEQESWVIKWVNIKQELNN